MKFAIFFEDDPKADPAIRKRHMAAHLAFLEAQGGAVEAAGPLMDADGAPAGGLWIVETANAAEAEALVKADPFWPTGLRKSFTIREWRRVFADGRPLIDL